MISSTFRRSLATLLCTLLLALGPSAVQAQVVPDRPGLGDGSAVVGAQAIQAELGYAYNDFDGSAQHDIGQLLLRYGVNDFLELRGGINSYAFTDGDDGYTGTSVGAKVRLWRSNVAQLSGIATTGLPTGTGRFESQDDRVRQTLNLAFDGALGTGLSLTVNGGLSFYYTDNAATEWLFIPTLNTSINERTGFYVGYGGFYSENANSNFVEAGLTYLTTPNTQIDVNTGLQLDEGSDYFFIGLGLAHRF
jgi:hypothetical protein